MPTISLTDALRREYLRLFDECAARSERLGEIDALVSRLDLQRPRYAAVAAVAGVPWHVVAVIHNMESSQRFDRHLHNGDPLAARTVQVPSGRPATGQPPFRWEESAHDALAMHGLGPGTDWTLAGTLYELERYNGWGYRRFHPEVLSPYLWAASAHYVSGKYVADGRWSATAVSSQVGAAVLLRRLAERGAIEFADRPAPQPGMPPLVQFSTVRFTSPDMHQRALDLQRWLNTFPGIFLREDGIPGQRTSDAFRRVSGHYLPGDPREHQEMVIAPAPARRTKRARLPRARAGRTTPRVASASRRARRPRRR